MGYIPHILIALASIAAGDLGLDGGARLPFVVPLLAVVPYALGWCTQRAYLRGKFWVAGLADRALGASAPILQLVAIVGLGWLGALEGWFGERPTLTEWPGLGLAAALLPFVVLQFCAIDARARLMDRHPDGVRRARSFQARLFLSAFFPFALYFGVSLLIGLDEELRVHVEEVALLNAAFSAALLIGLAIGLPVILRNTWDTAPLEPGRVRGLLEQVARAAGFRFRELLVWHTGNLMANAAIIGFTRRNRFVFFSDAILASLAPRELAAVFAHEIGHAKRHHALTFVGYAVLYFLTADLILTWADIESEGAFFGLFGAAVAAWFVSFGILSRRFELEADLVSMQILGDSGPLCDALEQVSGAHARAKSSWRHFSTEQRVAFLQKVERDPAVGRRLSRNLRVWSAAGLVAMLIVIAIQLTQLFGAVDEDRVVADLRLGRYAAAIERAEHEPELDTSVGALVARAGELVSSDPAPVTPASIVERARGSLEAGELDAAREWLKLASLRGERRLGPVFDALDALAGDDPAPERWSRLEPAWRAAFERAARR